MEASAFAEMDRIVTKKQYAPSAAPSKHLLCVVFLNAAKLQNQSSITTTILHNNMVVMKKHCEFAVLSYNCVIGTHSILEDMSAATNSTLALYRCVKSQNPENTHVSKPMMYDRLLYILPEYKRVWLLDEDLSLKDFQPDIFFSTLDCAFYPRPPPLVVQPVITESTQDYDFANLNTWQDTGVFAAEADFIEIQMPLFDAVFFDWYVRSIISPIIATYSKGSVLCAGFDSMFCRSATAFAKKTFNANEDLTTYRSCAIITAPFTSVSHANLKTIPKGPQFVNNTKIQAHDIQRQFPSFIYWNFKQQPSGIYSSPKFQQFERITAMSESCPVVSYLLPPMPVVVRMTGIQKERNVKLGKRRQYLMNKTSNTRVDDADKTLSALSANSTIVFTKVFALYFPQFHNEMLNNAIWGNGFTDWDNLLAAPALNRKGSPIPAPTELGFYNLRDYHIRLRQRKLAKRYGVDGFVYHHYWFYEPFLGATLAGPLEAMLEDGEPNLPFAFHWANQQWTATWQGKGKLPGEILRAQNYPNASDPLVEDHYHFLKRFFHHRNYEKVAGVPVFMVFQSFDERVLPILARLRELAILDGFPAPGLHIPQFRVNSEHAINYDVIPLKHRDTRVTKPGFDADMYYPSNHNFLSNRVPEFCLTGAKGNETRATYLSAITTFDNTPRRDFATASIWSREWSSAGVIGSFENDMLEIMMFETCCQNPVARETGGKFMMVNAWNEWAEGMVLEPNTVHGRGFLEAILRAKTSLRKINCNWDEFKAVRKITTVIGVAEV